MAAGLGQKHRSEIRNDAESHHSDQSFCVFSLWVTGCISRAKPFSVLRYGLPIMLFVLQKQKSTGDQLGDFDVY